MKSKRRVGKARIKCANMNFVCDKCSHNILHSAGCWVVAVIVVAVARQHETEKNEIQLHVLSIRMWKGPSVNFVFIPN